MSGRRRFALEAVYTVVALAASVYLLRHAIVDKLVWALKQGDGDCVINWLGARAFEAGVDPYSPAGMKWAGVSVMGHPPTAVLWFLPFTRDDIYALSWAVGLLLVLMLLVHLVLLAEAVRAPVPIVTALLAYALVSDTTIWQYHVHMIQLSEPIALLYVLAWIFLRRDHELASGAMIGLALTLKPYAGLLLVLFALGRRWRAILVALAVYLTAVVIVTIRFGAACWKEFFSMMPAVQAMWAWRLRNASVQGIVLRAFHPSCGPRAVPTTATTLAAISLSLAIVAAISWQCRRDARHADERIDLPFALFVTASAWLNPVVWEHYDVTLLQPMAIALFAAWRLRARRASIVALIVSVVLVGVALTLRIDIDHRPKAPHVTMHFYEVLNWAPWPLVLLACTLLLWRSQRETTS